MQCDGIVAVAQHLVEKLPKNVPHSRIQVIPCGIDLTLFKPLDQRDCREQLGWAKDGFHVLFQDATGDPVKRPELAITAVDHLKELGVKAELHYLRGVAYEQVPVWMNASDALLVTSHHEGSPTIVKEALACNLPIVSVRVGDIPQRIQKIAGCYLSSTDPNELALNLQKVRTSSIKVEARFSLQDLSAASCADRLLEFYELVIGRRGRQSS
jgi:glycosyltransferase involved in cell wall biosynthesis